MNLLLNEADARHILNDGGHTTIATLHTDQDQAMVALSRLVDEVLTGDVARLTRILMAHYQVTSDTPTREERIPPTRASTASQTSLIHRS
jgi:hypothetical protein